LSFIKLGLLCFRKTHKYQAFETKSKINKYQMKFQEFLNSPNVFISNEDWKECYNKFKDDNTNLIIFDPPYVKSNNSNYNEDCRELNVYNELKDIKENKAKSYFILEEIEEIKELFKEWNMSARYPKIYGISKRETFHIVYSN
jgi:tRNA1(Val) A37 N6-methylase TrmN6